MKRGRQADELEVACEIQGQECYGQDDENCRQPHLPGWSLLVIWIGQLKLRILGDCRKLAAEENVDQYLGVDCPAVGIEDRTQIALAEFCPCNET